jgi:hypothetical protein
VRGTFAPSRVSYPKSTTSREKLPQPIPRAFAASRRTSYWAAIGNANRKRTPGMRLFGIYPRRRRLTVRFIPFVLYPILNFLNPGAQGKKILQALISERKHEYEKMSPEQRGEIVKMFEESKATVTKAKRVKVSSRVNDVTSTLLDLEREVSTHLSFGECRLISYRQSISATAQALRS